MLTDRLKEDIINTGIWEVCKYNNMENVEVLVATMNQVNFDIVQRMNIQSDKMILN